MKNKTGSLEIRYTADGSCTLYSSEFDSTYHSHHGAIQESNHVFIQAGLDYWFQNNPDQNSCTIFEMGFGTGLNCFLTLEYARTNNLLVDFHTIEKFPVSIEEHRHLNFANLLPSLESEIELLHQSPWKTSIEVPNLKLYKSEDDFLTIVPKQKVDLIYYDAFGPGSQPELWSLEAMEKIASYCKTGTVLVTFCAQGQFKRNLKTVGFEVERLPGPPGKREMTRAVKTS